MTVVGNRRAGIVDVAKEASVSLGTVSNVLNHPYKVAASTRARVEAAIDRLDFVPRESARQLRGRDSRIMAVLVPDLGNPFFVALAQGAEQAARSADLGVVVCDSARNPDEEARYLSLFTEQQIRGALLTPTDDVDRTVAALRRRALPFVLVDGRARSADVCSVSVDDLVGGHLATSHLIERGHRSIAFVSGPGRLQQIKDRRQGAVTALTDAGLPATALHELPCEQLTVAAGRDAGGRLLGLTHRPTAVFCANDLLALGVLQALYEAGLRVPDDMALVGYDDIDFAASAVVPLTSVRQPALAMGEQAARLLIAETNHGTTPHRHEHVVLRPELVVRRSTVPLVDPGQASQQA